MAHLNQAVRGFQVGRNGFFHKEMQPFFRAGCAHRKMELVRNSDHHAIQFFFPNHFLIGLVKFCSELRGRLLVFRIGIGSSHELNILHLAHGLRMKFPDHSHSNQT